VDDRAQAERWYLRSAELNFAPALRWLARAYEVGDGVTTDPTKAAHCSARLKQAHAFPPLRHSIVAGQKEWEQVDPLVRLCTGMRDVLEGALAPCAERHWFPWLLLGMGLLLLFVALLMVFLAILTLWGSPFGLPVLAVLIPTLCMILLVARGIRRGMRYSRSHGRLEAAAQSGDRDACYQMGLAAERGTHEVPRDSVRAREWFQKAAQAGHAESMVRLADLLSWGAAGLRDQDSATRWLEQAASLGHVQAIRKLEAEGLSERAITPP
jgi:hypothetical protein